MRPSFAALPSSALLVALLAISTASAASPQPSPTQAPFVVPTGSGCPAKGSPPILCAGNGLCTLNGTCFCLTGFTKPDCSYKRKSQLTAFLLSFFLGSIGVDRLYLELITSGVLKLAFTLSLCIIPCFPLCGLLYINEDERGPYCLHSYMLVVALCAVGLVATIAWWTIDVMLIAAGALHDGNGFRMQRDLA